MWKNFYFNLNTETGVCSYVCVCCVFMEEINVSWGAAMNSLNG